MSCNKRKKQALRNFHVSKKEKTADKKSCLKKERTLKGYRDYIQQNDEAADNVSYVK